jgi:hypothetical protein
LFVLSLVVGMREKGKSGRGREPSHDKARLLLPRALAEGWGCERLAKEAGVSGEVALVLLRDMSGKIKSKVEAELGLAVEAMRGVATAERSRVTARLAAVGSVCDDLLSVAGALVAELKAAEGVFEVERAGAGGEVITEDQGLERLERLAKVLTSAGKAAESSWKLFRSASGLELAERLTELQAREKLKAEEDQGEVWEVDFTLLSPE